MLMEFIYFFQEVSEATECRSEMQKLIFFN